MPDQLELAAQYRERAKHCRDLAESTRDDVTMKALLQMARDFEEEAVALEAAAHRNTD